MIDEAASNMATLAPELMADGLDRPGPEGDRARSAAARRITQTKRAEYFSTDLVLVVGRGGGEDGADVGRMWVLAPGWVGGG